MTLEGGHLCTSALLFGSGDAAGGEGVPRDADEPVGDRCGGGERGAQLAARADPYMLTPREIGGSRGRSGAAPQGGGGAPRRWEQAPRARGVAAAVGEEEAAGRGGGGGGGVAMGVHATAGVGGGGEPYSTTPLSLQRFL